MSSDIPVPRHDFYQSTTHLTVSVYIKGYGTSPAREGVKVDYHTHRVEVTLPALGDDGEKHFTIGPLAHALVPGECTERVLGTKIELKLAKDEPGNWTALLGSGEAPPKLTQLSRSAPAPVASSSAGPARKKNWDKLVDDELDEPDTASDPNAGGDAALQKLFSSIYEGADADTRRAMIKSFTESGGTSLSTDWSNVGKETVAVRPPDGMYEMKM